MHKPLKWLLALFVLAVGSDVAFGGVAKRSFDIRGKITSSSDVGPVAKMQHEFRCQFDAHSQFWMIEMRADPEFKNGVQPNGEGYRIVFPDQMLGSNGTNFFFKSDAHKVPKAPIQRPTDSGRPPIDNGIASRGPGAVPFGAFGSEFLCVWYAFLSKSYFADRKAGLIHPLSAMSFPRFRETGLEINGQWKLDRSGLPDFIQGSNFNGVAELRRVAERRSQHASPYSVTFEATEKRPFGDCEFPHIVKVEFSGYGTPALDSRLTIYTVEIAVDSISDLVGQFPMPPDLDGEFTVTDYSTWFLDKPTDSLMLANKAWPTEMDVKADHEGKLRLTRSDPVKSRLPALLLVVLVLVVPAAIAGSYFRKSRKSNHTSG